MLRNTEHQRGGGAQSPERAIWQAVIFRALLDATNSIKKTYNGGKQHRYRDLDRLRADTWLRYSGSDFRMVCALAGIDPDFLRDAYVSGRIDPDRLRASEKTEFYRQRDSGLQD